MKKGFCTIAYVYLPGRISRLEEKLEEMPTEFFYGALELREKGYSVDIFEAVEKPRRSIGRYIAEHCLHKKYLPIKTNPSILDSVWLLLPKLKEYDVVVATTTGIAFSLAFWKLLYRCKFSVIGIMNAILNYPLNKVRVNISRQLFNRMTVHLFGVGELDPMCQQYRLKKDNITVNNFGVDLKFWTPGKNSSEQGERGFVLAVGNDSMRDFSTLIEAARKIDRDVLIITRRKFDVELPSNVQIVSGSWHSREIDDMQLRELYRNAFCVVVPLKDSYQPSGQSVTLQAMACGKAVIISKTKGLWDTQYLKDRENILFNIPEDSQGLVDNIKALETVRNMRGQIQVSAREYVEKYGGIRQFSNMIEKSILDNFQ